VYVLEYKVHNTPRRTRLTLKVGVITRHRLVGHLLRRLKTTALLELLPVLFCKHQHCGSRLSWRSGGDITQVVVVGAGCLTHPTWPGLVTACGMML
jgi:hypothetical protein